MYWFTSDTHFGHANIIKYTKRPFKSLEQMNRTLIRNWNKKVQPTDTVFFLGDFCFKNGPNGKKGEGVQRNAEHWIEQLNGRIVFIRGNHDSNNSLKTIISEAVIDIGGYEINLVHNPAHADKGFKFNFCGHVHEKWKYQMTKTHTIINVGVDVWDFQPVSYQEIMEDFTKWKKANTKKAKKSK